MSKDMLYLIFSFVIGFFLTIGIYFIFSPPEEKVIEKITTSNNLLIVALPGRTDAYQITIVANDGSLESNIIISKEELIKWNKNIEENLK
jgi:hypothetical protein